MASVTVSAPGKVLVTGGYLVLRSLPGLTLSTTARFHTTARWATHGPDSATAGAGDEAKSDGEDTTAKIAGEDGGDESKDAGKGDRPKAKGRVDRDEVKRTAQLQQGQYDAALQDGNMGATIVTTVPVRVSSVQMWDEWNYDMLVSHPFTLTSRDGKRNKFVERAIQCSMQVLAHVTAKGRLTLLLQSCSAAALTLHLQLEADNDFYSQRHHLLERGLPVNASSLATLPKFLPCRRDADGRAIVAKTGMGSSAALVTSVIGCLASFLAVAVVPHATNKEQVAAAGGECDPVCALRLVHHIAQVSHALAQGKVGSGFDVASAALGSQRYVRVPAETLRAYLDRFEADDDASVAAVAAELAASRAADWEYRVTPFSLPRGVELMMADVCGGSETPSMVRKILTWKEGGSAEERAARQGLWDKLARLNNRVEETLAELSALAADDPETYDAACAACAAVPGSKWCEEKSEETTAVEAALYNLRTAFRGTRTCLKQMGQEAGVPVEPEEQTALADSTCEVPGVIAAGVPGAGGYDALYAIILSGAENATRNAVGAHWSKVSDNMVCPLLLTAEAGFGVGAGVRAERS